MIAVSDREWALILASRLWPRVDVRAEDECWLWLGAVTSAGYGHLKLPYSRKTILAHRLAYELAVGPIPERLEVDHTCTVTRCCNPRHLEPVTHGVNLARGWQRRVALL